MTADTNGVTVEDLRDYLASDAPAEFLQRLIEEAESNAHQIVGDDVDIELCRKNSDFNQAVRILADFDNTQGVLKILKLMLIQEASFIA